MHANPTLAGLAIAALALRWVFTRPGSRRFAERITAPAIDPEEHAITRSVTAIERTADRKALEKFAEYGSWRTVSVTTAQVPLAETAPGRSRHGDHASAVDGTEVRRPGQHARGARTSHEYTARGPDRAATVRAHDRVVCGALLHHPDRPARSLPQSGRLDFYRHACPTQGRCRVAGTLTGALEGSPRAWTGWAADESTWSGGGA